MEHLVWPDPKAAVIAYLGERLDVPVASRVPLERPTAFVRVLLAGGSGLRDTVFSDVAFTIESWDDDEQAAQQRAQEIRAHLRAAYTMNGHPVAGYNEWGPPVDLPDESQQWRYTFTFALRFRPLPATTN